MSGFALVQEAVPYCALVPGTKYRIQYHPVSNPDTPDAKINSGKAIGTFEKLTIDFETVETEEELAEEGDDDLEPMDTIGYAIFKSVYRVPGAKLQMGMDGFRMGSNGYRFPVFSQQGDSEIVVANNEVSFYAYTLPAHQSRMSRKILNKHTNVDVANEHSKMYFDKTTGGRRRNRTVKCRGGKPRITKKNKPRSRRIKPYRGQPYQGQPYQGQPYRGQPYQGPPQPPYVDPIAAQPRSGALPQAMNHHGMQLSWGDAAKLAAANAAGAVVAVVGEEAFEDV